MDKTRHSDKITASAAATIRSVNSRDLLSGDSRLRIIHDGVEYLLQVTRQGKLILTK